MTRTDTTQAFVNNAAGSIDSANNNIIRSFPPYDIDIYNSLEILTAQVPPVRINVPPPVASREAVNFLNKSTNVSVTESTVLSTESSNFWFKGLKADLDWNRITEDSITLNYDLNSYITPYSPTISGIWRPCIMYVDPITGDKNTNIQFSDTGNDEDCEAGLGLENFITITNPIFKTWNLDPGLQAKIDWKIPKRTGTCSIMGVLFWYRHYDIGREGSIKKTFNIPANNKIENIQNRTLRQQEVRIDGKIIKLKAQHEDHAYISQANNNSAVLLYGLHSNLKENDYVLVIRNNFEGVRVSEDIYRVTKGLWICMGPKRFLPGVDIYLSDGFFSMEYDSYYLVKSIKGEENTEAPESIFEYYPKTNLITNDESKYRGCLNSLLNLSNNTTLEELIESDGLGITAENEPIHIYMNKEKRNKYIGLKNLARMLSTGPLVDMAAVYVYNKFLDTMDLDPYKRGNFITLKNKLEDVYGRLTLQTTPPFTESIASRIYDLPTGFFADDDITISINDEEISRDEWKKLTNTQIKINDTVEFAPDNNTITIVKNVYLNMDMSSAIFDKVSRSLYNNIENNDVYSIQDNLRIIKTKKDLALALTVFDNISKNFYLEFSSKQSLKMISSKTLSVPQVYVKMDFEHKRRLGIQTRDFWYKQRINSGGTEVYTKLKVPDDSEFEPGENESIVLSITDNTYTVAKTSSGELSQKKIIIYDFLGFDVNKSELYNSILTSSYDAFGVNQQFYKIIELQKILNNSLRDPSETYNLGLINGESYRITKRLNNWTWDFDKALRSKQQLIEDLNKDNIVFQKSLDLLDDRFLEANASSKTFYPDIKEVYFHRLGGVLFPNLFLFTIGKNIYWNYRTGPVPVQNAQYFIDKLPPLNTVKSDKILIQFECNDFLHIRLYDIEVENLRIDTYESSGFRPFPNKVPIRSDETRVYDQIIGYEFNEENYLLTTQFAPPIVAYGAHRKEDIDALGVQILNHPQPISQNPTTKIYDVLPINTLPFTAKNSKYLTENTIQRNLDYQQIGAGGLRDKSSVKCFLSPQYFYNEVVFRKGFFHPNQGWIDYRFLNGSNSLLKSRTPVISGGSSNCKTYGSYGKRFFPELTTGAAADAIKQCKPKALQGKEYLVILDPMKEYNVDQLKQFRVLPNIITTNVDNDISFISFISAKLSFLNHAFPKDLRIALFDPREYRFIAGQIVDKTIAYDLHFRQCQEPPPPESEIKKLLDLRIKENNSWIGPLGTQLRTSPRHLLFNNTLLNYKKNFNLTFNNYGRDLKYAVSNDIVLAEDGLDYYIGSSGIIQGFGEFSMDSTAVSSDSDNTWGLQISDMGGLDVGSTCFQLQVCTGCPVPNYDVLGGGTGISITPHNLLAYNTRAFDLPSNTDPYPTGYCFIADFTNKKHLIPPINLDAPYNSQITQTGDFPCEEQPDPPGPREFIKPVIPPEPVFIPPIHFPLVGLLTHMSIMQQMMSMGYDMPYGAFGGVYTPNPFTDNVSIKAKNRAYLENKGYLQVEGTTASFLRGYGYMKGLSLSKDYKYGIPNKVEVDIKYRNCLWYTIEADIFKYTEQCSPVLDNTKFKYLVYKGYENYPSFDFECKLLKDTTGREYASVDGARPFYSFVKNEPVNLVYTVLRPQTQNGITSYSTVKLSGIFNIQDITVPSINNPQYVPSVIDNSFFNENNGNDGNAPIVLTDMDMERRFLPGTKTFIYLGTTILSGTDKFVSGHIEKTQNNTVMLYHPTYSENDPLVPFGKWRNSDSMNMGNVVSTYIKDQLFSEGSYGWGSDKNDPKLHPTIKTPDLLGLHNFDYHFGKTDYCGRIKIINNNKVNKIIRFKYDPRIKYANTPINPHAQSVNNEHIRYTGYPTDIKDIKNRIYAHNIFSITDANRRLFDFETGPSKYEKYYLDKNIAKYYLPYYDLTLDPSLLSGHWNNDNPSINMVVIPSGQNLPTEGVEGTYYKKEINNEEYTVYRWNAAKRIYQDVNNLRTAEKDFLLETTVLSSGIVQFENIFSKLKLGPSDIFATSSSAVNPSNSSPGEETGETSRNNILNYNDNYYWISIPAHASGALASSSKIPYSIKQECDYLGANWASLACQNVCNTQMVGPLTPEDAAAGKTSSSQNLSMFYLESGSQKCPQVNYELRETTQNFYMGCGEFKNDSIVRLDLAFRYYVPEQAHAFVSARELLENNNEIRVRFKYIPRKIQTDFTLTLGQNAVNQSQLYFWECHETNPRNLYNERTRLNKTPPFFQVLNEMIFRAWFGERQKIATQDTFGVDTFVTQNHYKWVPYEYDNSEFFDRERSFI
jgi:hypothetical protein